jgi:hypothetical protein
LTSSTPPSWTLRRPKTAASAPTWRSSCNSWPPTTRSQSLLQLSSLLQLHPRPLPLRPLPSLQSQWPPLPPGGSMGLAPQILGSAPPLILRPLGSATLQATSVVLARGSATSPSRQPQGASIASVPPPPKTLPTSTPSRATLSSPLQLQRAMDSLPSTWMGLERPVPPLLPLPPPPEPAPSMRSIFEQRGGEGRREGAATE